MDASVYIVQGTEIFEDGNLPEEQPLLFSKGLKGQGQVIGIADTGIDHDSCFFHDANVTVPLCKTDAGTGKLPTAIHHRTMPAGRSINPMPQIVFMKQV
jgi:hypothetical protein